MQIFVNTEESLNSPVYSAPPSILIKSVLSVIYLFVCFIYLNSMTEGPEGHLYCQRNTKVHKYTAYGTVQKQKKTKK